MNIVYVPQEPSLRVPGGWKPKYDLSEAKVYGQLTVILEPGNTEPEFAQAATDQVIAAMQDIDSEDYLLPIGDPVLIAIAAAAFAESTGGLVRLLRWDGRARCYTPFEVFMNTYKEDLEKRKIKRRDARVP